MTNHCLGTIDSSYRHYQLLPPACASLLCCDYLAIYVGWFGMPLADAKDVSTCGALWAFGVHNDGETEILGMWFAEGGGRSLWETAFNDLQERGVEAVRFVIATQFAMSEVAGQFFALDAGVLPSIEEMVAAILPPAVPRHRNEVASALGSLAAVKNGDAADTVLRSLECSGWAQQYPQILIQWQGVLARWAPVFSLPAHRQRLILATDRRFADLHARLIGSIARHGPFADEAAALDFVADALARAERRLDRERVSGLPRVRSPRAVLVGSAVPDLLALPVDSRRPT